MNNEIITQKEKDKHIESCFYEVSTRIGIAPITKAEIEHTKKSMEKNGVFTKEDTNDDRTNITIKSLVKNFIKRELKITEDEWRDIDIISISPSTKENSDTFFVKVATLDDAHKITTKVSNLKTEGRTNPPRIVPYVPTHLYKRRQDIEALAFHLRKKHNKNVTTTIRNTKRDYLLLMKNKNYPTPWREVIPYDFNGLVSDFDIGIAQETEEETKQRTEEEEERMKEIEDDIINQRLTRKRHNEKDEKEEETENKINKENEENTDINNKNDEPTEMTEPSDEPVEMLNHQMTKQTKTTTTKESILHIMMMKLTKLFAN